MVFKRYFSNSAQSIFFVSLVTLALIAGTGCTRAKRKPKAGAKPKTETTAPSEQKGTPASASGTPAAENPASRTQVPGKTLVVASSPTPDSSSTPTPNLSNPAVVPQNFSEWVRLLIETNAVEIDYSVVKGMVKNLLEEAKDKLPANVTVDQAVVIVMAIASPELKETAIQQISKSLEKQCGHLGIFSAAQDKPVYDLRPISSISKLKSEVLDQALVLVPQMENAQVKGPESDLFRFRVLNLAAAELENIKFAYSFDPKKVSPNTDLKPINTSPELKIKGLNKAFEALLKEKLKASIVFVIQPSILASPGKAVPAAIKMLEQQAVDIQKGESWISSIQYADDLETGKTDLDLTETIEKIEASKQAILKGDEFKAYIEARVAEGKVAEDVIAEYSARYDKHYQRYYPELNSTRVKHFYDAGISYLQKEEKMTLEEATQVIQPLLPTMESR